MNNVPKFRQDGRAKQKTNEFPLDPILGLENDLLVICKRIFFPLVPDLLPLIKNKVCLFFLASAQSCLNVPHIVIGLERRWNVPLTASPFDHPTRVETNN